MKTFCQMDTDELERFATGRVSDEEVEEFEEHLLVCESCRVRFEEAESYARAVRAAAVELRREQETAARTSRWSWPRLIPVLAAVILLLAGVIVAGLSTNRISPPVAVTLIASRGAITGPSVTAGKQMLLNPDMTGVAVPPPYRLDLVTEDGHVVWQGRYTPGTPAGLTAPKPGTYFIRAYSTAGELLREFGLNVGK